MRYFDLMQDAHKKVLKAQEDGWKHNDMHWLIGPDVAQGLRRVALGAAREPGGDSPVMVDRLIGIEVRYASANGTFELCCERQQGDPNAHESVRTESENAAPVWSGDGLPPVGAVVDVSVGGELSECLNRVVIVGHDKVLGRAVYRDMDWSDLEYDSALADAFRPIRSEEDKAVSVLAHDIAAEDERSETVGSDYGLACHLYRAGYRKEAK